MKTALTFLFVILLHSPALAQDLPPDILADQYLLEASKALEKGDSQKAIQALGKIEALDIDPPPEFAFFAGKMLVENSTELESLLKGQALLKEFVISAGRGSAHYTSALELLSEVGAKIEEVERQRQQAEYQRQQAEYQRQQAEERRRKLAEYKADIKKRGHLYWGRFKADMVRLEGRTFTINSHQVQVSSFEISKTMVPWYVWDAVTEEFRHPNPLYAMEKVATVSWDDAQMFLQKLNTGKLNTGGGRYRLPSEAELAYALKAAEGKERYKGVVRSPYVSHVNASSEGGFYVVRSLP